jgi:trk system potassium uptake protein
MLIIVGGCGYVGSAIAERFAADRENDVVVIDSEPRAFDRLGSSFNGDTVVGSVIDRDVLEQAGIGDADGFVAVTRSDNTNLMAVQIARRLYGVPRSIARLFNPDNEEVYRRLGISYVSSTGVIAKLFDNEFRDALPLHVMFPDEAHTVVDLEVDAGGHGMTVEEFESHGPVRITALQRDGRVLIPAGSSLLERGDVVTTAVDDHAVRGLAGLVRDDRDEPTVPDGEHTDEPADSEQEA